MPLTDKELSQLESIEFESLHDCGPEGRELAERAIEEGYAAVKYTEDGEFNPILVLI